MFDTGFCWVKINGYSYIAKLLQKEDNSHYTISIGDNIFTEVPVEEMIAVYGDTDLRTIEM